MCKLPEAGPGSTCKNFRSRLAPSRLLRLRFPQSGRTVRPHFPTYRMSNFNPDGPSDNEWDERGDLAWNEFDWEQYLRHQDEVVIRYLAFYEQLKDHPERLDEVAHVMGWDKEDWSSEGTTLGDDADDEIDDLRDADDTAEIDSDPYTLHKNPIFIALKAIQLSLKRSWESIAHDPQKVPQSLALTFQSSLHRGDENATLAIQALDFGDYAMAISLFKRALRDLNRTLSLIDEKAATFSRSLASFREDALNRLFDLREIYLRVMNECREELERPVDGDDNEK